MLLVFTLLLTMGAVMQPAKADSPIYVNVNGPIVIGVQETREYTIGVVGGPAETADNGNYSYQARIVGAPKGASVLPSNGKSPEGVFNLRVTGAETPMEMTLEFNITSSSETGTQNRIKQFKVSVIEPIVISAVIENRGAVEVKDVPVSIYGDGKLLEETKVTLGPTSSTTLTYNWTDPSLEDGEHQVTVVLDAQNEFVTFQNGGDTYSMVIHLGEDGGGIWDIVLGILLGLMIFITYIIYRRPKRRRR